MRAYKNWDRFEPRSGEGGWRSLVAGGRGLGHHSIRMADIRCMTLVAPLWLFDTGVWGGGG
ncbi:MAG TPA: hypothetical protein VHC40_08180, partial [Rhizomicrobium sp.]|nr:hypothetical protein [Rhizomicrobium sp.]